MGVQDFPKKIATKLGARFVDLAGAALLLDESPCTLDRWAAAGVGPQRISFRGNRVRYSLDDLADWLEALATAEVSPP